MFTLILFELDSKIRSIGNIQLKQVTKFNSLSSAIHKGHLFISNTIYDHKLRYFKIIDPNGKEYH